MDTIARYRTLREKTEATNTCIKITGIRRGEQRLAKIIKDLDTDVFASEQHISEIMVAAKEGAAQEIEEMSANGCFDEAYSAMERGMEMCREAIRVVRS